MAVLVWSDIHHDFVIDNSGDLKKAQNAEAIHSSITNIMRTSYGERIMRRSFGCGCKQLLFELIDDDIRSIVVDTIYKDILKWENRVTILSIDFESKPDSNSVSIFFRFAIKGYNDIFLHTVSL